MNEAASHNPSSLEEELRSQVRLTRSVLARRLYVIAGTASLALGILGIVLPVLPTTPLLLLTAGCYARGSERFYLWLLINPYFGRYIRDWREKKGVPLWTKVWVIALLWAMLGTSILFVVPLLPVKILLACLGIGVSLFIWRQPTRYAAADESIDS